MRLTPAAPLRRALRSGSALALALALAGCNLVNDMEGLSADLRPSARPVTVDTVPAGPQAALGRDQHPRILATYGGAYDDPKVERMVAGIVGRLTTVQDNPGQTYRVTLLDSPSINAFALPGGYVYVTRGLLALASDSAELAGVIAHEMAHVTASHGLARQRLEERATLATRVVDGVLADDPAARQALIRGKLDLARFSREQELQADALGIKAMGEAGFDPYAAASFQEKMAAYTALRAVSGAADPSLDFLATHPSSPQRLALALAHARRFGGTASFAGEGTGARDAQAYLDGIDGMAFGDTAAQGFARGTRFLHPGIGLTLSTPAGFTLDNRPEALLATGQGDVAIRFDGADWPAGRAMTDYLLSGWVQGLDAASVRPVAVNGLDGATGRAAVADWDFDVTAVRHGAKVYRALVAAPRGSPLLGPTAAHVRASLRPLAADEAAALKPLRVRVRPVAAGQTVAALAAGMVTGPRSAELLRALNGLKAGQEPVAGQRIKVIGD